MSAAPAARPAYGAGGKVSGHNERADRLLNSPAARTAGGGDVGEGERLSKRVAQMLGCSRREAEQTIEGGWVRVDGQVVEIPQQRVLTQTVTVDPDASLMALGEVTLILHKPPNLPDGVQDEARPEAGPTDSKPHAGAALGRRQSDPTSSSGQPRQTGSLAGRGRQARAPAQPSARDLLIAAKHSPHDASGQTPLLRHFKQLQASVPLETAASGLVVFTQDWRVQRKLQEDMAQMEHELMVEVRGEVQADALTPIERALRDPRQRLPVAKISISSASEARSILRLAVKGAHPGLAAFLCELAGLEIQALRRIRLGRVSLGDVAPGHWRYLADYERF
jgi:23S rRNA pseudouridine2604 synthase